MNPIPNYILQESALVVFTYLNGYICDAMALPDSNNGQTVLNAGNDTSVVQAIFANKPNTIPTQNLQHAANVAKRLLQIYSAGSCAIAFFNNQEQLPNELNLDVPAKDMQQINKIQDFLQSNFIDHPSDYPTQVIVATLNKMQDHSIWSAIIALAEKMEESPTKFLKAFDIEDTLMMYGIKRKNQSASASFVVGVSEDKEKNTNNNSSENNDTVQSSNNKSIDYLLAEFLFKIKQNWTKDELDLSIMYLKKIFEEK